MPAPDLATLFDLAGPVEEAVQALFHTAPRIITTYTQRETGDLCGERCDVQFTQGAWANRWGVDLQGNLQHSAWAYTLRLTLFTRRTADNEARHASLRGQMHAALSEAVRDPDFLRYHTLASLNEQAATEQVQASDDLDVSVLTFTGLATIRSDAWPFPPGGQRALADDDGALLADDNADLITDDR